MCRIDCNTNVKDLVPQAQEALNEEWENGWDNQWDNNWDDNWDDDWDDDWDNNWEYLDAQLSPLQEFWELVEEEEKEDWDSECIEGWTWELYRGDIYGVRVQAQVNVNIH